MTRPRAGYLARLLVACALLAWAVTGQAASVQRIFWDSKPQHNRFILTFDEEVRYNAVDSIREKGFFYIDVYGIPLAYTARLLTVNDASLRYVHAVSYADHGVLRLVFYVQDRKASFRVSRVTKPPQLVIDTMKDASTPLPPQPDPQGSDTAGGQATTLNPTGRPAGTPGSAAPGGSQGYIPSIPEPRAQPPTGTGSKKIVIIDAGHGGANTGATANQRIGGRLVYEKDIVLQFALRLKRLIDASPNMKAYLTRSDDSLVTLEDRVRYSERHLGNLFVSLHLNDGAGNPAARGVEIYFLNEKGTVSGAEKAVQDRENTDVAGGASASRGTTPLLKKILTDLERRKLEDWQYESYLFCRRVMESLGRMNFYRLNNRGIKSANFLVLKNFYMPAVLLEIGFITNKDDLMYVVNPTFQQSTAVLLYNAINKYFAEVDPTFRPQSLTLSSSAGR